MEYRPDVLGPSREGTPYKLPRTTSSNTGGKEFPERAGKQEGITATGQYDSSSIYEQFGRDSLCPCHKISKRAVDVVPTERYTTDSTASAREGECDSRQGVESDEGSL